MAKKSTPIKAATAAPEVAGAVKTYRVKLKEKVYRGNDVWLMPGRDIRVSAKVLEEIRDKLDGDPVPVAR